MAAEEDKAPRTVKLKKCNPLLEKRIHVTIAAIDDNPPTAFFNFDCGPQSFIALRRSYR